MSRVSNGVQEFLEMAFLRFIGDNNVYEGRARVGHRVPWPSIPNCHLGPKISIRLCQPVERSREKVQRRHPRVNLK